MSIPSRCRSTKFRRRFAITLLPVLAFTLLSPVTVSCQRTPADQDRGLEELRDLVRGASGKPAPDDLTRIETRYARTRTAALARFLKGFLYYSAQNFRGAVETLDDRAIGTAALGDYVLFYRAESEAA